MDRLHGVPPSGRDETDRRLTAVAVDVSRRRLRDVRCSWLFPILTAIGVATCAVLLYVSKYKNFYYDEWDFISGARTWDLKVFFLAHNEHWSTIPILFWKGLFAVF